MRVCVSVYVIVCVPAADGSALAPAGGRQASATECVCVLREREKERVRVPVCVSVSVWLCVCPQQIALLSPPWVRGRQAQWCVCVCVA